MGMNDMVDTRCLSEQGTDLSAIVAREIGAHSGTEIGGLADVEHIASGIAEEVDAGGARQGVSEAKFLCTGVTSHLRQGEKIVETGDTETAGALDEEMQ
jgi:hypothetical protein